MIVAINPGHYPGKDSGAVGRYSQEAILVEKMAKIVCSDLKAVGYDTVFIQENELEDITDLANASGADIFVSIHCNSCDNDEVEGTEVFHFYNSSEGSKLATTILNQLINTMDSTNRGVKEAGYYVIRHTDMTAVLVEVDFISNPKIEDYMNQNIEHIAHAISRGITDYVAKG